MEKISINKLEKLLYNSEITEKNFFLWFSLLNLDGNIFRPLLKRILIGDFSIDDLTQVFNKYRTEKDFVNTKLEKIEITQKKTIKERIIEKYKNISPEIVDFRSVLINDSFNNEVKNTEVLNKFNIENKTNLQLFIKDYIIKNEERKIISIIFNEIQIDEIDKSKMEIENKTKKEIIKEKQIMNYSIFKNGL
jgi:hypothetical protein